MNKKNDMIYIICVISTYDVCLNCLNLHEYLVDALLAGGVGLGHAVEVDRLLQLPKHENQILDFYLSS